MPATITAEIKREIIAKIKSGAKATDIADQYAVARKTVYGWLGGDARSHVSFKEYQRVRKERDGLRALVGELLLKQMSGEKKRGW